MKIFISLLILLILSSCQEEKLSEKKLAESCPKNYVPVCGQPKMVVCPKGQLCPMVMPQPRTYANMCFLNQAQAKFLSNAACPIY